MINQVSRIDVKDTSSSHSVTVAHGESKDRIVSNFWYSDGKTKDEIGFGDTNKIPRYNITSATTTIPFSKFGYWAY